MSLKLAGIAQHNVTPLIEICWASSGILLVMMYKYVIYSVFKSFEDNAARE